MISSKIKVLGSYSSQVSYALVQPLFSTRKRRQLLLLMLLSYFGIFVGLVAIFTVFTDIDGGPIAVGLCFAVAGLTLGRRLSRFLNQRRMVGEIILKESGFHLTTRDRYIPYDQVAKIWHCVNFVDNYFTKRPGHETILVKILTHDNEKYHWEMDVQPLLNGKPRAMDSTFLGALDFLEALNPRYGLHQNSKLCKLKIHETSLAEGQGSNVAVGSF